MLSDPRDLCPLSEKPLSGVGGGRSPGWSCAVVPSVFSEQNVLRRLNVHLLFGSRKLGTAGQKLGGAAVLCHIKHDPVDLGGSFTLTSANVGKCQTVLCRNGKPLPLSRSYVMSCEEELKRIKQHKAIITEVRRFSSDSRESSAPWWRRLRKHLSSEEAFDSKIEFQIQSITK